MKIYTLIQTIKANSGSVWNGREICADTTRDKVLWGDAGQECTVNEARILTVVAEAHGTLDK